MPSLPLPPGALDELTLVLLHRYVWMSCIGEQLVINTDISLERLETPSTWS